MDSPGVGSADAQPCGFEAPFLTERLHESAELRAKVSEARRLGISLKRFDGWEPKTYSWREKRNGRMVTVTEREPEWDLEQQEWMLALSLAEADECPGCHGRLSETTLPENDGAYLPKPPTRCNKCTAVGIAADHARNSPQPQALLLNVEKR